MRYDDRITIILMRDEDDGSYKAHAVDGRGLMCETSSMSGPEPAIAYVLDWVRRNQRVQDEREAEKQARRDTDICWGDAVDDERPRGYPCSRPSAGHKLDFQLGCGECEALDGKAVR